MKIDAADAGTVEGIRSRLSFTIVKAKLVCWLCALIIAAGLLLGGGTRSGFLADAILQLLSLPLLLIALIELRNRPGREAARAPLYLCAGFGAVPLIQLIPLPPEIWTALPGRDVIIKSFELLGEQLPWWPITLSPRATWLAALSALPAIAVFLGTCLLNHSGRRSLSLLIVCLGGISAFLGMLQVAQGPQSVLRFYEVTNALEAVGFFANRNHFAALLYSVLLFLTVWTVEFADRRSRGGRAGDRRDLPILALAICFALFVALLAAEAMARSRAGLALTILALLGASLLAMRKRGVARPHSASRLLAAAAVFAGILIVQFSLFRILERFGSDPIADLRVTFARNTVDAARAYMPVGSGLGTFVSIYGLFEKPEDLMLNLYANHAHNDFLEIWLETGVFGPVLAALFLAWFGARFIAVWKVGAGSISPVDSSLRRAAALVILLLLLHSIVDYPLRTSAMMIVTAFACALLVDPPTSVASKRGAEAIVEDRTPADFSASIGDAAESEPIPAAAPAFKSWTEDSEWPEEWKDGGEPKS